MKTFGKEPSMPVEHPNTDIRNDAMIFNPVPRSLKNREKTEQIEKLSQPGTGQFRAILSEVTNDTRMMNDQSGNGYTWSKLQVKAYIPQEYSGFATNIDMAA